ncbi:hypothetical protein FKG85_23730, partial [Salmonella enterica]|nr:hypothetical protein [Salmonella enterica]
MLGFVSALSSAVAVMILLLSVLLANLLSVAITKDNKLDSANLTYEADNKDQTDVVMGKGFSLSVKDL